MPLRRRRASVESGGAGDTVKPIVEQQCRFAVVGQRLVPRLDDQRPVERTVELRAHVRVVHERTFVGRDELVHKRRAWGDRLLRQIGHPVHPVVEPDPVPMDRRRLRQLVLDLDPHPFSLPHTQLGAWDAAVETPRLHLPRPSPSVSGAARSTKSAVRPPPAPANTRVSPYPPAASAPAAPSPATTSYRRVIPRSSPPASASSGLFCFSVTSVCTAAGLGLAASLTRRAGPGSGHPRGRSAALRRASGRREG